MFRFIVIFSVVFINAALFAQAPDTMWTKTFGNSGVVDRGRSVQQTTDGGYIIAGITEFRGNNNEDVWLIKTNANGDTMWTRIFGGTGDDLGNSVQETSDGGYIINGSTSSFGAGEFDIWLIKTDANGDTLWTRTFGDIGNDWGNFVDTTSDGGYIIAGGIAVYTRSYGSVKVYTKKVWLIKTDANGDTLWTRTFGDSLLGMEGTSVQQTMDGGYIITGSYRDLVAGKEKKHNSNILMESTQGSGDWIRLIKTDNNGNTLWNKTIKGINRSWANSTRQTIDGGYIITGVTNISNGPPGYISDLWLIKTDINGDTLWTETFDRGSWDEGNSVKETADGGYIIAGPGLIKTDNSGDILWTSPYGGYSVQQTSDGGYIIAGTRVDPGFDVLLIKTAPDVTTIEEAQQTLIEDYHLEQNYPNPFNPTTAVEFSIPKTEFVTLKVYNILGEEVATLVSEQRSAGSYKYDLDTSDFSSGVYMYRIQAGDYVDTKKMVLLR